MTRGFNKVILIGNVTKDAEIRYTASQAPVASFGLAVNRTWKAPSGEIREDVTFVNIVVWGKLAEICERYVKKGMPLFIEGRLSIRNYETKTGEKRVAADVIADNFQFLSAPRRDGEGVSAAENRGGSQSSYSSYGASRYSSQSHSDAPVRSYRDSQSSSGFGSYSQNDTSYSLNEPFPADISELGPSSTAPAGGYDAPKGGSSDDEADIPF